jgi:hypothetical protein
MKNINQLKVVLALILGLGGVIQGSSSSNGASSHSLNRRGPAKGLHANVPNGENPEDNLRRGSDANAPNGENPGDDSPERFCQDHYLVRDAKGDKFVIIDNQGTVVFPPKENIFLPSGELASRLRCIVLPSRLFERFVRDYSSSWLPRRLIERFADKEKYALYVCHFHWMKTYNDDEKGKIYRQIRCQNRRMHLEDNKNLSTFVLVQEGRNNNGVVVNGQGYFFRSLPDGVNRNDLPRVEVSWAIFEKLTKDPAFVPTTLEKVELAIAFLETGVFACEAMLGTQQPWAPPPSTLFRANLRY